MSPRRAATLPGLLLSGALMLAGCEAAPGPTVRDHYASLDDCVADWGAGNCDRLFSSGYSGGAFVFRSPPYPQDQRDVARRQAAGDGAAVDPSRAGRVIATVRDPVATDGARSRGFGQPPPAEAAPGSVAETLVGLPYFAAFYGIGLMLLTLALAAHVALAPYRELRLIRDGNTAAAASLAGVLLGLALPLARVLESSATLLDLLAWGTVALVVQLLVFTGVRLAMPAITVRVREGQMASGVFLGTVAAVLGLLNAAAVTLGFE